jgi:hypothetical protein
MQGHIASLASRKTFAHTSLLHHCIMTAPLYLQCHVQTALIWLND